MSAETSTALGMPVRELGAAVVVDQIGLRQHEHAAAPRRAPISCSTSSTARGHRHELLLGHRGVDDVEDQVGQARLLERRAERVDQLVGQLADEADGVGQQIVAPARAQHAGRRIERVEQPVADADARPR